MCRCDVNEPQMPVYRCQVNEAQRLCVHAGSVQNPLHRIELTFRPQQRHSRSFGGCHSRSCHGVCHSMLHFDSLPQPLLSRSLALNLPSQQLTCFGNMLVASACCWGWAALSAVPSSPHSGIAFCAINLVPMGTLRAQCLFQNVYWISVAMYMGMQSFGKPKYVLFVLHFYISISLHVPFDLTSIPLRCHFDFTSNPPRVHFDFALVSPQTSCPTYVDLNEY